MASCAAALQEAGSNATEIASITNRCYQEFYQDYLATNAVPNLNDYCFWIGKGGEGGAGGGGAAPGIGGRDGFGGSGTKAVCAIGGGAGGSGNEGGKGGNWDGEGYLARGINTTLDFGGTRSEPDYVWGHPALERTITFTYQGKTIASVPAQMGRPLPVLATNHLYAVKGYTFAYAYQVSGSTTNFWYGADGERLHDYEGFGDVSLEVAFMPRWDAMAMLPEGVHATYAKTNLVAYVPSRLTGCHYLSGITNAVNAGVYSYTVGLDKGYEIWSDFETNDVHKVEWTISKVAITNDWKDVALRYDWTKSREENIAAVTSTVVNVTSAWGDSATTWQGCKVNVK